jgi:hypothetical protein
MIPAFRIFAFIYLYLRCTSAVKHKFPINAQYWLDWELGTCRTQRRLMNKRKKTLSNETAREMDCAPLLANLKQQVVLEIRGQFRRFLSSSLDRTEILTVSVVSHVVCPGSQTAQLDFSLPGL